MKVLLKDPVAHDLPAHLSPSHVDAAFEGRHCNVCLSAKTARLPFGSSTRPARHVLDIVHSDLQGPYRTPSRHGSSYMLLIVDGFSDRHFALPIRTKSAAAEALRRWIARAEVETGRRLNILRTDGGGEYASTSLNDWLQQRGVRHEVSLPYTPQQDGKSERGMRTLGEVTRALLLQADLPHSFWEEAVAAATDCLDQRPSPRSSSGETRLRRWDPSSSVLPGSLRPFGCPVVVHTDDKSKFGPRGVEGVYLGPLRLQKGHLVRLSTGQVVSSRNVRFLVGSAPFPEGFSGWKGTGVAVEDWPPPVANHSVVPGPAIATPPVPDSKALVPPAADLPAPHPLHDPALVSRPSPPPSPPASPQAHDEPHLSPLPSASPSRSDSPSSTVSSAALEREALALPRLLDEPMPDELAAAPLLPQPRPPRIVPSRPVAVPPPLATAARALAHQARAVAGARAVGDPPPPVAKRTGYVYVDAATHPAPPDGSLVGTQGDTGGRLRSGRPVRRQFDAEDGRLNAIVDIGSRPPPPSAPPRSAEAALAGPFALEWREAMDAEMASIESFDVFDLVTDDELPPDTKLMPGQWVFTSNAQPEGATIIKFKARWVARGDRLVRGVDYSDVYSPVADGTTRKLFLSKVAREDLAVRQGDFKTAFLAASIDRPVYMRAPPGYRAISSDGRVLHWRVTKALYGFPQSPRAFFLLASDFLQSIGFRQSAADSCLFAAPGKDGPVYILIYVDDFLLAGSDADVDRVWEQLCERFRIDDRGRLEPGRYLGLDATRRRAPGGLGTIDLCMSSYIGESLEELGLNDLRPRSTPMDEKERLVVHEGPLSAADSAFMVDKDYKASLGRLNWLVGQTRFDIAYATQYLGRFQSNPSPAHWEAMRRVWAYLKGTAGLVLRLGGRPEAPPLVLVTDASWAPDPADSVSTRGQQLYFFGDLVSWTSKRLAGAAPSRSSLDSEFVALSEGSRLVEWVLQLLPDLGVGDVKPVPAYCDNKGAIAVIAAGHHSSRTRHIALAYNSVFHLARAGSLQPRWTPTDDMPADVLTKPLGRLKFQHFRTQGGLVGVGDMRPPPLSFLQLSRVGGC